VIMKMGLFQMTGGTEENPVYELGSPIFDEITITLDQNYYKGKSFKIITENNSKENFYIQSAHLNGRSLKGIFLNHNEIVSGGELFLKMGSKPNKQY